MITIIALSLFLKMKGIVNDENSVLFIAIIVMLGFIIAVIQDISIIKFLNK